MKKQWMRWAALAMAAALLMTAAGCGQQSSDQPGAAGEPKDAEPEESAAFVPAMDREAQAEIRVRGSWSNFEALEAAVNDWNEIYSNVLVDYAKVDGYTQQLAAVVRVGDRQELVLFDTAGYYEDREAVVSALADLGELGLDLDVFDEQMTRAATVEDKVCTLNWGLKVSGFVVNQALLEENGLSMPTDRESFWNACQVLREAGYTPIQGCTDSIYANLMNNDWNYRLESQQADLAALARGDEGSGSFFDPEYETMLELKAKGYVDLDVNNAIPDVYEGSILAFFEGDVPFLAFNSEGFSGMAKRESKSEHFSAQPFDYACAVIPVSGEEAAISAGFLPGLALVEGSANQDWGAEFLRFLCQKSELDKMAAVKGVPAVTRDSAGDARFAQLDTVPAARRVNQDISSDHSWVDECMQRCLDGILRGNLEDVEAARVHYERSIRHET
ncbi:MAG: ABC transporter substrate-binding protein [Clostridia bacterium]|nr:ABC transporter substrate-binding protein [Clostridia bacterium]